MLAEADAPTCFFANRMYHLRMQLGLLSIFDSLAVQQLV